MVAALQRRSSVLAYAAIFPEDAPPPSVAVLLARWCDQLIGADGRAWPMVMEVEDEVVGSVLARLTSQDGRTGEIWGLYVDPLHWGNGFGPALLEAATNRLRETGATEAHLWVLEANTRARTLYERAGWKADGSRQPSLSAWPDIAEVRYQLRLR